MVEFEAEQFAILRSIEGLPAESVADLVRVGVPQSTEELLAESEAEVVKVASVRLLEELVVLLLGIGLE